MRYAHRNNWARLPSGRPFPAPAGREGQNGLHLFRATSVFTDSERAPRANEDVSLIDAPSTRFRSLLVPVDGERFSEHALPIALAIARRSGADVRLVHVHQPVPSVQSFDSLHFDNGFDTFHKLRQQSYLNDLCQRLAKLTPVRVTPLFLQRPEVAPALCETASAGTDLVVMATHGRGPLGRVWFGSVGDSLMRQLSVPLLFVRGYTTPVDLTGNPLMHHMLIPLDGSELAEQVLDPALALGALSGAEHTLLRVIRSTTDYYDAFSATGSGTLLAAQQRADAWSYLQRVAEQRGAQSLRVVPRLVFDEQPTAKSILSFAEAHCADVIALATRGRGGWERMFRGSVADRVLRGATGPVLVINPEAKKPRRTNQ